ncbi:MAG: hypothetical protein KBT34_11435 [Prevotella sp.]|nr:hypothetical protein [Candidatus Prevotella equi]
MKLSKTLYLHSFALLTVVLALVRCVGDCGGNKTDAVIVQKDTVGVGDSVVVDALAVDNIAELPKDENFVPHRIWSVASFKESFPDSNSVQLVAAQQYGVKPVKNRLDAERRKSELVYAGSNPYFSVDKLRESIPYLVPRASVLLQDIGKAFYDSLYVKGVPLHQIIVTSVLRSEEDVERLRRHNGNASDNSCHRFGTTFDICYNRYVTVQTQEIPKRQVQNDTLKWVLSEVLRDMRQAGRCYVKYEVKQGCFHITTR